MSSPARFFIEGAHAPGDTVELTGADARKVRVVLRMRTGDGLELIDSQGTTFQAHVEEAQAVVRARLDRVQCLRSDERLHVTVAQALPKGQKMDFVVEKLTELGVAAIVPLVTERSLASRAAESKLERWRRLARAASQQSGRSAVPEVREPTALADLTTQFGSFDLVLMPWELADRVPLRGVLPALLGDGQRILVVIGPEGGFSQDEAASAAAQGAHAVWLGSTILRTETAALVVVAILNYCRSS